MLRRACGRAGEVVARYGGEELAVILPGSDLDAEALRAHMKELLAPFKVPRYIWFVNEPLPRNANGKFLKREVRDKLDVDDAV